MYSLFPRRCTSWRSSPPEGAFDPHRDLRPPEGDRAAVDTGDIDGELTFDPLGETVAGKLGRARNARPRLAVAAAASVFLSFPEVMIDGGGVAITLLGVVRLMPTVQMDLLRTFATVADLRSFTRAGDPLRRTQPAIGPQIKRLEELIQAPLLEPGGTLDVRCEMTLNLLRDLREGRLDRAIAISAEPATPERSAIAHVGEGAIDLSFNGIPTCVREQIPVTAVVFNNRR